MKYASTSIYKYRDQYIIIKEKILFNFKNFVTIAKLYLKWLPAK